MEFPYNFPNTGCLILLILGLLTVTQVICKKDPAIYCGACSALIDEVQHAIDQEDPRRTIDVGSFRIDPNGKRKHETIPYAGSEAHLHELVEEICNKMDGYGLKTDPETSETSYARYRSWEGEVQMEGISLKDGIGKKLKIACGNILEEYEDDLIGLFKKKSTDIYNELCVEISGYCEQEETGKDEL